MSPLMLLNKLRSLHSKCISFAPVAFPYFIPLSEVCVYSSLMIRAIAWLGSPSSVSTFCFSLFIGMLHYWHHRFLLLSSFTTISPVALLTLHIWHYVLDGSVPRSCNSIYLLLPFNSFQLMIQSFYVLVIL